MVGGVLVVTGAVQLRRILLTCIAAQPSSGAIPRLPARRFHAGSVIQRAQHAGSRPNAEFAFALSSSKQSMRLGHIVPDHYWKGPTAVMMTMSQNVIFQQQVNLVSNRAIRPV